VPDESRRGNIPGGRRDYFLFAFFFAILGFMKSSMVLFDSSTLAAFVVAALIASKVVRAVAIRRRNR